MSYQLMGWASQQTTGSPTRKAVLLALANCANHHTGRCDPSVEILAQETELGERAIRQALKDLTDMGLIQRTRKRRADGSLGTYHYVLAADPAPPAAAGAGDPAAADAAQNQEETSNQETEERVSRDLVLVTERSSTPRPLSRARGKLGKVDRKPVTPEHEELAESVLGYWNVIAKQDLTSRDWLAKIVMRIREHPDLTGEDHYRAIFAALADPWWTGHPSPSVVYGNGATFERALTASRNGPAPLRPKPDALRYGRGMTTRQILEATGNQ